MNEKVLIIGAGPSLDQNLIDFKRLGPFPGTVLCTDGGLEKTLLAGIIPDYCATLEDTNDLDKYYITDIVVRKGHLMKGCYISDRVHPVARKAIKDAGIKMFLPGKVRGYITSNVGLFCWLTANTMLGSKEIYLIGLDHCYGPNESPPVDQNSQLFKRGFQVLTDPYNNERLILHPAFQLWREEFNWYSKKFVSTKTYNLTGRGALYEKQFIWQPISQMKSW